MRAIFLRAATAALALFMGVIVYLAGCGEDKGTGPSEPKEYYAYFGDLQAPNTYFRYNTLTCELDSFYLPYDSHDDGFCISPDGGTMYLHPDDAIVEVSLDSFQIVAEHPIDLPKGNVYYTSGHELVISLDGRYLAVLNGYLHIVRLNDYSILYSDSSKIFTSGWFTNDGNTFFCGAKDSISKEMWEVSLDDSITVKTHTYDFGTFSHIVTSPDNRLWFYMFYLGYGFSYFRVYNAETDSFIFGENNCPGAGHMAITPNGRYVAYTRPGTMQGWCSPYPYVMFYDVTRNTIDHEVYTFDETLGVALFIDELWYTPDSREVVGISVDFDNWGELFHYEFKDREIKARFRMPRPGMLYSLKGQSRP